MIVFRATNVEVLHSVLPHLVEDEYSSRAIIVGELAQMMTVTPNKIFVSVAFEGKELVGYTIGWIPYNRNYVWLGQSWCGEKCSREIGRKGLEMIKEWAVEEHDIHEIRFKTARNGKAMARVWEFEIREYIMGSNF